MKTTKEVGSDILKAKDELKFIREQKESKGEKALSAKIKTMRLAKNYLEFKQATIEAVKSQKETVTKHLKINKDRYKEYQNKNPKIKIDREMFYKNCDIDKKEISKWNSELKFLNYLLSNG